MQDSKQYPLRIVDRPTPEQLGPDAQHFLRWLGGPAAIRIHGRDSKRCRALITLLHGNERSGVIGLHTWLRTGSIPAVDILIVLGAVTAAIEPPGFAHRMLPGRRDLNRCFAPPHDDEEGRLAQAIAEIVRDSRCECLVDLHNNTGRNPPYGIVTEVDAPRVNLVALFGRAVMVTDLRLGTLVEVSERVAPAVAIECGRTGDPAADDVARAGIARYVETDDLALDRAPGAAMTLFEHPVRVRLRDGLRIAFGPEPATGADITFTDDIESYNFETVPAGTHMAWLADDCWPFEARGADGRDVSRNLFEVANGVLRTSADLVPVMMTTDPVVAAADCLCYIVSPRAWSPDEIRTELEPVGQRFAERRRE